MKIKNLLLLLTVLSASFSSKAQCSINVSDFNQQPIICFGGDASISLNITSGVPPYSYDFDSNTGTITGDTMIWAESIISFSNEYSSTFNNWSAADVLGAPDTYPNYGDIGTAWTTATGQVRDFISVSYPATIASNVYVYETNEPGSTDTVYVRQASTGNWIMIYSGTATTDPAVATIKNYPIPGAIGAIDGVRLAIDGQIASYYEVDAIGIRSLNVVYPFLYTGITDGTYNLTITDNNGCTFDTTLTFTEPSLITYTQNVTICSNQTVEVGSSSYNTTGNYTDYLTSVQGCDSIVYTNLTVNTGNATYFSQQFTLCAGGSVTVGTITHSSTGLYSDTLVNSVGCDSVVTTDLFVYTTDIPVVNILEMGTVDITSGGTASSNDYYGSNLPADAFDGDTVTYGWGSAGYGFPSWLAYDYGVGNEKVVKSYSFICSSSMTGGWGNSDYDPYSWNLQAFNGTNWINLDSRVEENPVQDVWFSYTVDNNTAYQKYRLYFTDTYDGDYVMITELRFFGSNECNDKAFVAIPNDVADPVTGFSWTVNGNSIGNNDDTLVLPSFNYGDTILCTVITTNSCASVTTGEGQMILLEGTPNATASSNQLVITAEPTGLAYQWIDCNNSNAVINGETSQTFTATANGSYAAVVTNGNCPADTSACIAISTVGIDEQINNENILNVYPNPNNGTFIVEFNIEDVYVIVNNLGQVVQTLDTRNDKNKNISVVGLTNGVYYIQGLYTNVRTKFIVTK